MRTAIVCAMIATLGLTACGDASGPGGNRLSRSEAIGLAGFMVVSSEVAAAGSISGVDAPDANGGSPPISFSLTHESTHPCPAGGELAVALEVTGTLDQATHSLEADLAGSHTHIACAFLHPGVTITLDGAPLIGFEASVGATNGLPSQPYTFSLDGAVDWSTDDGRSGLCTMTLVAITDFAAQSRSVEGTICGHTVRQTATWTTGG